MTVYINITKLSNECSCFIYYWRGLILTHTATHEDASGTRLRIIVVCGSTTLKKIFAVLPYFNNYRIIILVSRGGTNIQVTCARDPNSEPAFVSIKTIVQRGDRTREASPCSIVVPNLI